MHRQWLFNATCDRVVDGDTLVCRVDLGFKVSAAVTIRLRGVNAPEIDTAQGKEASDWMERLLLGGDKPLPLMVQSYKDRLSFARWVCDVWDAQQLLRLTEAKKAGDDALLAKKLIDSGHGVPLNVP